MTNGPPAEAPIRLAELMASLSLATDLGMGQPLAFALSSCVLAIRLGDALGLSEQELRNVYYQSLLRYIGCNAETSTMAALFGDEIALRTDFATIDQGRPQDVMALVLRYLRLANAGAPPVRLARAVAQGLLAAPRIARESFAGHCEVAQRLAERLQLGEGVVTALGQLYERWDGKGLPQGLKGEAITIAVRVVSLAQDMIIFHRIGGIGAALETARERSGGAYDPHIVECFCRDAPRMLSGIESDVTWETVLAIEPGPRTRLTETEFDTACEAMADFADIKSSYLLGHSVHVAEVAAAAAAKCGLSETAITALRRAALLHDIGRVGISAGIWDKPGPFTEQEWERVRLHPYYTERVLTRSAALAPLGKIAAQHHERLDGSGYFRGVAAPLLAQPARLLAAADSYAAMTEARPHRPALSAEAAAAELTAEVRAGRLDEQAAYAVLAVAGHAVPRVRRPHPAGLTEREIEVLRLLARGSSMRDMAHTLVLSPKTVDNHIQHIYSKIGVSTRAAATLFAMEHDLLRTDGYGSEK
jgi:HD-GYP domain-containing protein (c-di-GMP phosphodiesterase class II)